MSDAGPGNAGQGSDAVPGNAERGGRMARIGRGLKSLFGMAEDGESVPALLNGRIIGDLINTLGVFLIAITVALLSQTTAAPTAGLTLFASIGLGVLGTLIIVGCIVGLVLVLKRSRTRGLTKKRRRFTVAALSFQLAVALVVLSYIISLAVSGELGIERVNTAAVWGAIVLVGAQVLGQGVFVVSNVADFYAPPDRRSVFGKVLRLVASTVLAAGLVAIFAGLFLSLGAVASMNDPDVATATGALGWFAVEVGIIGQLVGDVNKDRTRLDDTDLGRITGPELAVILVRFVCIAVAMLMLYVAAASNYSVPQLVLLLGIVVGLSGAGTALGIGYGLWNWRQKLRKVEGSADRIEVNRMGSFRDAENPSDDEDDPDAGSGPPGLPQGAHAESVADRPASDLQRVAGEYPPPQRRAPAPPSRSPARAEHRHNAQAANRAQARRAQARARCRLLRSRLLVWLVPILVRLRRIAMR